VGIRKGDGTADIPHNEVMDHCFGEGSRLEGQAVKGQRACRRATIIPLLIFSSVPVPVFRFNSNKHWLR